MTVVTADGIQEQAELLGIGYDDNFKPTYYLTVSFDIKKRLTVKELDFIKETLEGEISKLYEEGKLIEPHMDKEHIYFEVEHTKSVIEQYNEKHGYKKE